MALIVFLWSRRYLPVNCHTKLRGSIGTMFFFFTKLRFKLNGKCSCAIHKCTRKLFFFFGKHCSCDYRGWKRSMQESHSCLRCDVNVLLQRYHPAQWGFIKKIFSRFIMNWIDQFHATFIKVTVKPDNRFSVTRILKNSIPDLHIVCVAASIINSQHQKEWIGSSLVQMMNICLSNTKPVA